MAVSRAILVNELKKDFPTMRKPKSYADLLLQAITIDAVDAKSAKRRSKFLESQKVKDHVFVYSYENLGLLVAMKNADTNTVIWSERVNKCIFSYALRETIVKKEQQLLLEHASLDSHVKTIIARSLKLPHHASISAISNALKQGILFKQVNTYKNIFAKLKQSRIAVKGYMALRIVTIPVSHYYLSNKAKDIIAKCRGR